MTTVTPYHDNVTCPKCDWNGIAGLTVLTTDDRCLCPQCRTEVVYDTERKIQDCRKLANMPLHIEITDERAVEIFHCNLLAGTMSLDDFEQLPPTEILQRIGVKPNGNAGEA